VNNQRVAETTLLQHGATLRFGRSVWRFIDPGQEGGGSGPVPPHHHGSTATLDFQVSCICKQDGNFDEQNLQN
jgi:hypothetical protein